MSHFRDVERDARGRGAEQSLNLLDLENDVLESILLRVASGASCRVTALLLSVCQRFRSILHVASKRRPTSATAHATPDDPLPLKLLDCASLITLRDAQNTEERRFVASAVPWPLIAGRLHPQPALEQERLRATLSGLRTLDLQGHCVKPHHLSHLSMLSELSCLILDGHDLRTEFCTPDHSLLRTLPALQKLVLLDARWGDDDSDEDDSDEDDSGEDDTNAAQLHTYFGTLSQLRSLTLVMRQTWPRACMSDEALGCRPALERLTVGYAVPSTAWLRSLSSITTLTSISILDHEEYGSLTDKRVDALRYLPSLQSVYLDRTLCTWDKGYEHWSRLSQLTHLCILSGVGMDVAFLKGLTQLEHLEICELQDINVVSHVRHFSRLTRLVLAGGGLCAFEGGCSGIAALTALRDLALHAECVTSACLADVAALTALTALELASFEAIAPEDAAALESLSNLQRLDVRSNWHAELPMHAFFYALTTVLAPSTSLHTLSLKIPGAFDCKPPHLGMLLARIAQLTALRHLLLAFTAVDGGGGDESALRHLTRLSHLQTLVLDSGSDCVGADCLARIPTLETLSLRPASTEMLQICRSFAESTQLTRLELNESCADDEALLALSRSRSLRRLSLRECARFTLAGIEQLRGCSSLRCVDITIPEWSDCFPNPAHPTRSSPEALRRFIAASGIYVHCFEREDVYETFSLDDIRRSFSEYDLAKPLW